MYINSILNVIVPMAGAGTRFSQAGYTVPKPFIKFLDRTMIEHVISNLKIDAQYTFIVQQEHIDNYNAEEILRSLKPGCKIVPLNGITDGAARSVLYTRDIINNDNPILIVNSDNMIDWDSNDIMESFVGMDGGIVLIEASGPKWSYACLDEANFATKLAEKIEISTHATTGHYYWGKGSDFVKFAESMIFQNIRYNNEFYIAPVYNLAIHEGARIFTRHANKFWSVGTPEELQDFLQFADHNSL